MDEFGFEQLSAWLERRMQLPPGPLFCVIDGRTRGRRWAASAARAELRELAVAAGVRRRFAPHQLRHDHAVELAREGVAVNIIQRQLGHYAGDPVKRRALRRARDVAFKQRGAGRQAFAFGRCG
jgi:integrase